MATAEDIQTTLEADVTLMAILTGGVFVSSEMGPYGFTRDTGAAAFDSTTGLIKPCLYIKTRSNQDDDGINDGGSTTQSTRQINELYFYDDEHTGYAVIRSARSRVKALLHNKEIGTIYGLRRFNKVETAHDPTLNAALERDDYECRVLES